MAFIGIGFTGNNKEFLLEQAKINRMWLAGDRQPRFFGDRFCIMYDSNTAREFIKKCQKNTKVGDILIYHMSHPIKHPF